MPNSLKLSLLSLMVLLGACRSAPVHYHTLMPPHAGGTHQASGEEIQIERLTVPAQVDRTQIVIREGNSGLAILEFDWWGATLADEFQGALQDQLDGGAQRKSSVRVEVQRFDSLPGHYALLEAKWRLRSLGANNNAAELTCRTTLQTPSGATIDELVAAHQNNVKRLAATINQASRSAGTCPAVH